jgi:hypothetical protein
VDDPGRSGGCSQRSGSDDGRGSSGGSIGTSSPVAGIGDSGSRRSWSEDDCGRRGGWRTGSQRIMRVEAGSRHHAAHEGSRRRTTAAARSGHGGVPDRWGERDFS